MDSEILSAIKAEAARVYPQEACGVVVKGFKKGVIVPCRNVAADPLRFFEIDSVDYAKAAKQGEILAIWHSHPEAPSAPSGMDLAGVEATAVEWIIIGIYQRNGQFVFDEPAYVKPTGYAAPYLERPYLANRYDCYGLVRDFYQREFGIWLNTYPHSERWWDEGGDLLAENFANEGFIKLVNQAPQYGDLFLIQSGSKVPNHVAVYVGDDQIIHHCYERLSRRDTYGGSHWQKHTTHHLRHQSKC